MSWRTGRGSVLIEHVCVGFLCFVFTLFGGLKEGVVAATQLSFQIAPRAMEGARGVPDSLISCTPFW